MSRLLQAEVTASAMTNFLNEDDYNKGMATPKKSKKIEANNALPIENAEGTEESSTSRRTIAKPAKAAGSETAAKRHRKLTPAAETGKTVWVEASEKKAPKRTVTQEEIACLAYSYWEARGCQGGSPHEDWIRAERELYFQ